MESTVFYQRRNTLLLTPQSGRGGRGGDRGPVRWPVHHQYICYRAGLIKLRARQPKIPPLAYDGVRVVFGRDFPQHRHGLRRNLEAWCSDCHNSDCSRTSQWCCSDRYVLHTWMQVISVDMHQLTCRTKEMWDEDNCNPKCRRYLQPQHFKPFKHQQKHDRSIDTWIQVHSGIWLHIS